MIKRYENKNICSLKVFADIVANSKSFNEICEVLKLQGYDCTSLTAVRKRIEMNNIPTEHLRGKSWNKNSFDYTRLVNNSSIHSSLAAKGLILKRGNKCECCGNTSWLGKPIHLEVHHVDGNKTNNDENNLVLLCPNCHSYTDNFRGRNQKKLIISDQEFAETLSKSKNIRQALLALKLSPKGANYKRAYYLAEIYNIRHILEP